MSDLNATVFEFDLLEDDQSLSQLMDELDFKYVYDDDDIILSQMPMPDSEFKSLLNEEKEQFGFMQLLIDDSFWGIGQAADGQPTENLEEKTKLEPSLPTTETLVEQKEELNNRFAVPVNDDDIRSLVDDQKNVNTRKNTSWAINVFNAWRESRCTNATGTVPLILDMDATEMNFWLSRFVVEMRKQNGEEYPPKSIYLVMCGLLCYLRDNGVYELIFLDNNNDQFSELRKVLDAQMKNLLKKGIGIDSKTADPILPEEENKLWTSGSLGNSNAKTLQHTVFYYACKLFGLRGFDEHRSLECTQFSVGYDERGKFIHFLGKNNKTCQGGLASMKVSNKNIKHYCDEGPRCVADYFQQYIQAINHGTFYRRPLAGLPIRYGEQPVGVNTLKTFMKSICEKAGLKGNFTNHSGKKTCATALYDAGVDEQEIMGRTGHRSEMAVRKYKRATPNVQQRTSNALNPPIQDIGPTPCDEECTENKQTKHGLHALSDITNTGTTFHGCTFNFKS